MSLNIKAYVMLVLASIFWAGNFIVGKFAFVESISPFSLVFFRWITVWFILLPFTYKEILEAWIVGYEIIIGLGLSLGYSHYEKGWHAASTLGTIGVAATIGKLIKLNSKQMLGALSIASSSSAGMKIQFGNEMKVVHLGLSLIHI